MKTRFVLAAAMVLSCMGCTMEDGIDCVNDMLSCDSTGMMLRKCVNNKWENDKSCPMKCQKTGEGEASCIPCSAENCSGMCDNNGQCISKIRCEDICAGTCDENGKCIAEVKCSSKNCTGSCDENGKCVVDVTCTAENCDGECDANGKCVAKVKCSEETCDGTCNEKGECVIDVKCTPETCDGVCDESGKCTGKMTCSEDNCDGTCDENGNCIAEIQCSAENCDGTCDENGKCIADIICTEENCAGICGEDGKCIAEIKCTAENCAGTCDENGNCIAENKCPSGSCSWICDANGDCVAENMCSPETCDGTCDENGHCVMRDVGENDCTVGAFSCDGVVDGKYLYCQDGKWDSRVCPSGMICDAGSTTGCKEIPAAKCTNGVFKDNKVCINGEWLDRYATCADNMSSCPDGFVCVANTCVNSCDVRDNNCLSGFSCLSSDNRCHKKCIIDSTHPISSYLNDKNECLCDATGFYTASRTGSSCKNDGGLAVPGECLNGTQNCENGEIVTSCPDSNYPNAICGVCLSNTDYAAVSNDINVCVVDNLSSNSSDYSQLRIRLCKSGKIVENSGCQTNKYNLIYNSKEFGTAVINSDSQLVCIDLKEKVEYSSGGTKQNADISRGYTFYKTDLSKIRACSVTGSASMNYASCGGNNKCGYCPNGMKCLHTPSGDIRVIYKLSATGTARNCYEDDPFCSICKSGFGDVQENEYKVIRCENSEWMDTTSSGF